VVEGLDDIDPIGVHIGTRKVRIAAGLGVGTRLALHTHDHRKREYAATNQHGLLFDRQGDVLSDMRISRLDDDGFLVVFEGRLELSGRNRYVRGAGPVAAPAITAEPAFKVGAIVEHDFGGVDHSGILGTELDGPCR
jgi:hypothetical protein